MIMVKQDQDQTVVTSVLACIHQGQTSHLSYSNFIFHVCICVDLDLFGRAKHSSVVTRGHAKMRCGYVVTPR